MTTNTRSTDAAAVAAAKSTRVDLGTDPSTGRSRSVMIDAPMATVLAVLAREARRMRTPVLIVPSRVEPDHVVYLRVADHDGGVAHGATDDVARAVRAARAAFRAHARASALDPDRRVSGMRVRYARPSPRHLATLDRPVAVDDRAPMYTFGPIPTLPFGTIRTCMHVDASGATTGWSWAR